MIVRLISLTLIILTSPLFADEVQSHGVGFEKWIRDTFFDGYEGKYTDKWDVSAEANKNDVTPKQGVPISIKLVKYGSPIGLGDILRQREIHEEFLMIVGFWQQKTPTQKLVVEVECLHFTPESWDKLWGDLSVEKLKELDAMVKDKSQDYKIVREAAKKWKSDVLPGLNCEMVVNPKIGSTTQRRVQCSMPFKLFWHIAGRDPYPAEKITLFGKTVPNSIESKPRTFNK